MKLRTSVWFGLAVALGAQAVSSPARADVSSWASVGFGGTHLGQPSLKTIEPTMRLATGLGTDPSHPWIGGGLLKLDILYGSGTDLSLTGRLANQSFVNGGFGFAFDLGPTARFWGTESRYGAAGTLVLGAPWGLQVELGTSQGQVGLESYSALLAIDLARLTVYRRTGSSYFRNPFPAYRPEGDARSTSY